MYTFWKWNLHLNYEEEETFVEKKLSLPDWLTDFLSNLSYSDYFHNILKECEVLKYEKLLWPFRERYLKCKQV